MKEKKYDVRIIVALGIFSFILLMNTCSNFRTGRQVSNLDAKIDTVSMDALSKDAFEQFMIIDSKKGEIENLKTSKRVLYDWNSIVRTVVRPDDRMNHYDQEILRLEQEIDELQK